MFYAPINLHDRIGQVINTQAFRRTIADADVDLIDFQLDWNKSGGQFENLPKPYQDAIIAGEQEISRVGDLAFA